MEKSSRHASIRPSHPAEIVSGAIDALELSKTAFAAALGISRQTLYDFLAERQGVSASMAVRLEAVLGSSAEFWLNLQVSHDLWRARQSVNTRKLKRLAAAA